VGIPDAFSTPFPSLSWCFVQGSRVVIIPAAGPYKENTYNALSSVRLSLWCVRHETSLHNVVDWLLHTPARKQVDYEEEIVGPLGWWERNINLAGPFTADRDKKNTVSVPIPVR